MVIRSGRVGSRITVSEGWKGTESSPSIGGSQGRLPAASTKRSAVKVSPGEVSSPATSNVRSPTKWAARHRRVAEEVAPPLVRGHVPPPGPPVPAARRDGVDPAEDAVADGRPVHA